MVKLADGRAFERTRRPHRAQSQDAAWTAFVRCWRNLMSRWCRTCAVIVPEEERFYPEHYHGTYFE